MNAIKNYYDLTEDMRISDFKVPLYQKEPNEEAELIKETENNKNMYQHLNKITKGYLFGKIVSDFKTALKFEGGHPIVEIYMSEDKWDYEPLKQLIANLRQELVNSHFTNKMQAIEYFEQIKASVFGLIDQLKEQGVI